EVFLHIGFGRRPAVQASVEVDRGQILALLGGEGLSRATHAGHAIQLLVRASPRGGTHECTLSGRTEPNRAGGTAAASERRQTRGAQVQARADSVGGGRRRRR